MRLAARLPPAPATSSYDNAAQQEEDPEAAAYAAAAAAAAWHGLRREDRAAERAGAARELQPVAGGADDAIAAQMQDARVCD